MKETRVALTVPKYARRWALFWVFGPWVIIAAVLTLDAAYRAIVDDETTPTHAED